MTEAATLTIINPSSSETTILETLQTIVPNRACVEMRGQNFKGYWFSGFYDKTHLQKLAHDAQSMELHSKGIYVTLNSTNPDLLARRLNRMEAYGVKQDTMTTDKDITQWDYLPIDIDPKRPSGISSTADELKASYNTAMLVKSYLTVMGFPDPLVACSGNGCHLLYKIHLSRSPEHDVVVKNILYNLAAKFNTEKIAVDVANNNPSRIFKLYGTWARKGENTIERPHRLSYIKEVPEPFLEVSYDILMAYSIPDDNSANNNDKRKSKKLKNPQDVVQRHPELMKIVGKMVNSNYQLSTILIACQDVNSKFDEPKPDDVLKAEVEKLYEFCKKRQIELSSLPDYIFAKINEKTGEITGYYFDFIKYSSFLASLFGTVFFNETIYIYDKTQHIYVQSTNEVETHIRNSIVEHGITVPLTTAVTEILAHLSAMGGFREYPFNCSTTTLPVKNGILKIRPDKFELLVDNLSIVPKDFKKYDEIKIPYNTKDCVELLPHGKEHLFTYTLDAEYDPTATTKPAMDILKQWIPTEKDVIKLLQAPAQGLVQMQTRHSHKKAYMIQGETNSGKTSYFKLLIKLFTKDFVSAASLQSLCEDKFVGSEIEGKIINVRDDLQAIPLKTCEQFKEITGDCSIRVERKYQNGYRGWATAVLMFSCNYPPNCGEDVKKDAAFWGRIEYIKFPYCFKTNIGFYGETYTDPFMSGFLNLLLRTVLLIHQRGELLEVSEPGEVLMNWSADADPIQNFMEDVFVETGTTADFSKPKLFAEYIKWFKLSNMDPKRMIQTENQFTSAMAPYFIVADHRLPKNASGVREHIRVFRGPYLLVNKNLNLSPESNQKTFTLTKK